VQLISIRCLPNSKPTQGLWLLQHDWSNAASVAPAMLRWSMTEI